MLTPLAHGLRSWKSGHIRLAVAALAIGIGATTAIYSVVQAVLLDPLPWTNADRYSYVFTAYRSRPASGSAFTYGTANAFAERATTTDAFGCYASTALGSGGFNVTFNGQPVHVEGAQVSPSLIRSLGVNPALGRIFDDPRRGSDGLNVAVISTSLWQRLGSDPQIAGKTLDMNGTPYQVTGVMPAWFRLPVDAPHNDVWIPLKPPGSADKGSQYLYCIAKRKAGVSQAQLHSDLLRIQTQTTAEGNSTDAPDSLLILPVLAATVDSIRPTLLLLLGAAAALLLIACANVASLLLARAVSRSRETAVRVSLGANTWQLGLQYFAEGLLVAIPGAVAGALASLYAVHQVLALAGESIPRSDQIGLSPPVLAVTLGLAVLCAVLFSFAPLWQARQIPPQEVLSDGARTSAGAGSRGLLRLFVIGELVLAFGLVAMSALLYSQFVNLQHVPTGFDSNHLLSMRVLTPFQKYGDHVADQDQRLARAFQSIPGVESAGFAWRLPLHGQPSGTVLWLDGQPQPELSHAAPATLNVIHPDFFRAMRIPLLEGRFFGDSDREEKQIVPVIINEAAARQYWRGADPLGSYARIISAPDWRLQIIGVVADVKNISLAQPTRPEVFLTFRQGVPVEQPEWVIRSSLSAATLIPALRQAAQQVDPEQAIFDLRPMPDIVSESISRERLSSFMVSFFGISALLLAILGVYGVVSYSVRQRTTEMGTRMALGATSGDLIRLVVGDGLKMAVIGIGIGVIAVYALARYLATTDLKIEFSDPYPLMISTMITAGFASLACFIPAWRTSLLSPLIAIRNEPESMWREARSRYFRFASKVSGLVSAPAEAANEMALLTAIVDSTRQAGSFGEAIQAALSALRESLGAEFVVLLSARSVSEPFHCTGASPESYNKDWTLPANALVFARLRYYSSALPISSGDIETWLRWAREHSPDRLPELETLKQLGAELAVSVANKSESVGVLLLGPPVNREPYTSSERRILRSAGAQFAMLVENGRLTDRIVEQEKLRRELMVASEVQKRLFPEKSPETAVIQCAGLCIPARGVGGDYYDFLDLGNDQIGIALADVAGKGIAAALVMSVVQASLRSIAETGVGEPGPASLADLAVRMNRLLHRSTGTNSYATFFYSRFDPARRELRYVNAGHNPPFLLRAAGGEIEELSIGGTIIGMFPIARYEEGVVELHRGDVLLAFTDGVSEAHNPAEEEFGEDRLKDLLRRTAHLPVAEMSAKILEELKVWMSDAVQFDDLTFIAVKIK
jgi:putative ABC transport system permease protein